MRNNILFLLFTALIAGCNLINPEETIPSYIYIEPFTMVENPDIQAGSLDHRISHVYAFMDNEFLGIFSLPALIPVLKEGEQELLIDPGIRNNGISSDVQIYPFYERYTTQLNIEPGKIDTIKPRTRYKSGIKVHFIEDFESGQPIFSEDRDGNSATYMDLTNEEVFEGFASGVIRLDTANILFDAATGRDQLFDLRQGGRIYMEVNYRNETDILFGLIGIDNLGNTESFYEFGLLPRDTWNKVYFNLTDLIILAGADNYQVVVTCGLPFQNGAFTRTEAEVYLDNIKLISF